MACFYTSDSYLSFHDTIFFVVEKHTFFSVIQHLWWSRSRRNFSFCGCSRRASGNSLCRPILSPTSCARAAIPFLHRSLLPSPHDRQARSRRAEAWAWRRYRAHLPPWSWNTRKSRTQTEIRRWGRHVCRTWRVWFDNNVRRWANLVYIYGVRPRDYDLWLWPWPLLPRWLTITLWESCHGHHWWS